MVDSKKGGVIKATLLNQISVLTNILVGITLLPIINNVFGSESLITFVKLLAIKAIFDLFTSALSGSFVRLMLDTSLVAGFKLSIKCFTVYGFLIVVLSLIYGFFAEASSFYSSIPFLLFIFFSLIQQPFLQLLSAAGYYHVPAIVRIAYNISLFLLVYLFSKNYTEFYFVLYCLLTSILISTFISLIYTLCIKNTLASGSNFKVNLSLFFKNTLKGYSFFAICLALCFQIETLILPDFLTPLLFLSIVIAWKVPNIIIQLVWRYCEINGLDVKRSSKSLTLKTLLQIKKVEKQVLVLSVILSCSFYVFYPFVFELWMGKDFISEVNDIHMGLFSFGILILSMNRVYSSILQYTDYAFSLGFQYFIINILKVLSILLLIKYITTVSYIIWFTLEVIFLIVNRRNVFHGFKK